MAKVFMKKRGLAFGKDALLDDLLEALGEKVWPASPMQSELLAPAQVELEAQVKAQSQPLKRKAQSAGLDDLA